jgi:hypothetical protein
MIQPRVGSFVTLNVRDALALMTDDKEAVEHPKCNRWHGGEIHGRNRFPMV